MAPVLAPKPSATRRESAVSSVRTALRSSATRQGRSDSRGSPPHASGCSGHAGSGECAVGVPMCGSRASCSSDMGGLASASEPPRDMPVLLLQPAGPGDCASSASQAPAAPLCPRNSDGERRARAAAERTCEAPGRCARPTAACRAATVCRGARPANAAGRRLPRLRVNPVTNVRGSAAFGRVVASNEATGRRQGALAGRTMHSDNRASAATRWRGWPHRRHAAGHSPRAQP